MFRVTNVIHPIQRKCVTHQFLKIYFCFDQFEFLFLFLAFNSVRLKIPKAVNNSPVINPSSSPYCLYNLNFCIIYKRRKCMARQRWAMQTQRWKIVDILSPYSYSDVNIYGILFVHNFAGLLSRFNCKWFDCIFATVKTTKSTKTNNADDELSIATRTRRFGTAIQSFILQRHHASVSTNTRG